LFVSALPPPRTNGFSPEGVELRRPNGLDSERKPMGKKRITVDFELLKVSPTALQSLKVNLKKCLEHIERKLPFVEMPSSPKEKKS